MHIPPQGLLFLCALGTAGTYGVLCKSPQHARSHSILQLCAAIQSAAQTASARRTQSNCQSLMWRIDVTFALCPSPMNPKSLGYREWTTLLQSKSRFHLWRRRDFDVRQHLLHSQNIFNFVTIFQDFFLMEEVSSKQPVMICRFQSWWIGTYRTSWMKVNVFLYPAAARC